MGEKPTWSPTWHEIDTVYVLQNFASTPPQRGGSHTKPGDHDTSKYHNPQLIITYYRGRAHINKMVLK